MADGRTAMVIPTYLPVPQNSPHGAGGDSVDVYLINSTRKANADAIDVPALFYANAWAVPQGTREIKFKSFLTEWNYRTVPVATTTTTTSVVTMATRTCQ